MAIRTVGFDGDDTLWHNETIFADVQQRFKSILGTYADETAVAERLLGVEVANLGLFGYGIKGFTLSMIETAIELTEGRIPAAEIRRIVALGKEMLAHPVVLIDGVEDVIGALEGAVRLILVTKGDLFDQETKIARSGLADRFEAVEIVSEKDETTYRRVLARSGTEASEFLMVGNSMRSDILPVLDLGAQAAHIPYVVTWAHEAATVPAEAPPGFHALSSIREVPDLIDRVNAEPAGRTPATRA